jgi:hypothetical protein
VIDPSAVLKQEGFPSECTNRAVVLQREAPFAIPVDRVGEMVSERQIRSLALAPLDVARLSQLLTDDPVIHPEGDNW